MEVNAERDCSVLGGLFQTIINDMKGSVPVWEDFTNKASKLHTQLKSTIVAVSAFLEAFQRIADVATNSRGATKDMGASLTRMCIRHKTIELKLKSFTNAIMECLVVPLQERMEEWKKMTTQLDKEHAKDYKKARQDIKKKSSDTVRLQKKARKGKEDSTIKHHNEKLSKADIQYRLDSAMHDVNDMYLLLEEQEKNAVRSGMIEERSRFCMLISCFKPVVDEEISMLSEVTRLESVLKELVEHGKDPYVLPQASEQIILDVKGQDIKWSYQTPPGSPSPSSGSRKSSMCSLSSMASSDSRSSGSTNSHSPGSSNYGVRHRSLSQPNSAYRLSSVSSQDSGFTSQDTLFPAQPGTPPQPVPEESSQQRLMHNASAPYDLEQQSSSECSTPSSPTPPPSSTSSSSSSASHFALPPSQASQGFAPPPPSWLVNFGQSEKSLQSLQQPPPLQRPKSIPTPLTPSVKLQQQQLPLPPQVPEKPAVSPKPKPGPDGRLPLVPDFNTPHSNQIVPRPVPSGGQPVANSDIYRQRSATLPGRRHTHSSMPSALCSLDSDGNAGSHGSLSTSSGYSTQSAGGGYSDETLPQDGRHRSLDGSLDHLAGDYDKPANAYAHHTTESMYTSTPNQSPTRRPMSMACVPTPGDFGLRSGAGAGGGGGSSARRGSKPPPPIRRTPSGGSLAGMVAEGQLDEAPAVFKRPHTPGRARSQSTVQAPYETPSQPAPQPPPPQGRVHRSQSLKLAGDLASDVARLSLMESLNAKLAQRGSGTEQQQPQQQQQQQQQQQDHYQQQLQQYQQQHFQQNQYQQYPDASPQPQYGHCHNATSPQQQQQQQQQQQGHYQQQQQQQQGHYQQQQQQQQQGHYQQQQQHTYQSQAPPATQPAPESFQQRQLKLQQQLQQQLQQPPPGQAVQQTGYYADQQQCGQSTATYNSQQQQQQQQGEPAFRSQEDSDSSEESDTGVGILSDIRRGVKLRRTISNDRSAPRV